MMSNLLMLLTNLSGVALRFAPNEEDVSKELLAWATEKLQERSSTNASVAAIGKGITTAPPLSAATSS
jgi:hypothetical protein